MQEIKEPVLKRKVDMLFCASGTTIRIFYLIPNILYSIDKKQVDLLKKVTISKLLLGF